MRRARPIPNICKLFKNYRKSKKIVYSWFLVDNEIIVFGMLELFGLIVYEKLGSPLKNIIMPSHNCACRKRGIFSQIGKETCQEKIGIISWTSLMSEARTLKHPRNAKFLIFHYFCQIFAKSSRKFIKVYETLLIFENLSKIFVDF